jgi:hypothetical protein
MKKRVAVWGTGNVGRPAIRAVLAHRDLELVSVIVSNPAKAGQDAGQLAGVAPAGITASADWQAVLREGRIDALVCTATTLSSRDRPAAAMAAPPIGWSMRFPRSAPLARG